MFLQTSKSAELNFCKGFCELWWVKLFSFWPQTSSLCLSWRRAASCLCPHSSWDETGKKSLTSLWTCWGKTELYKSAVFLCLYVWLWTDRDWQRKGFQQLSIKFWEMFLREILLFVSYSFSVSDIRDFWWLQIVDSL